MEWQMFPVFFYNPNFQFILPSLGMHEQQWEPHPRGRERESAGLEGQGLGLGASRGLHEEVIRKNNQIIRNFLSKLNEVFARQEQYESGMKVVSEKLAKLAQTGENLQYEFRSTFLETSRQQSQLSNDIAVVKSALKIPSLTSPHEVYLSSDFFRERANAVNTRMRTGLRQRTNAGVNGGDTGSTAPASRVGAEKQPIFSNIQNSSCGGKHSKNRSELPPTQLEDCLEKASEPCLRHSEDSLLPSCRAPTTLSPRVEQLQQRLQACLTRPDLESSLSHLREELDGKLAALMADRKSECDWNHIDFDELQAYIDGKVEGALADKVGRKFFETSLTNLKEAWEQEERTICAAIETKADASELAAVKQKLAEIGLRLDQPSLHPSLKTSTICLNATLTPFIGKHAHHHRVSTRDFHSTDSPDTTLIARREDERRKSRANLQYTNTLSLCRSMEKKETRTGLQPNGVFDDMAASQGMMKERVWREKVNEALGEQKIKKKTKIFT